MCSKLLLGRNGDRRVGEDRQVLHPCRSSRSPAPFLAITQRTGVCPPDPDSMVDQCAGLIKAVASAEDCKAMVPQLGLSSGWQNNVSSDVVVVQACLQRGQVKEAIVCFTKVVTQSVYSLDFLQEHVPAIIHFLKNAERNNRDTFDLHGKPLIL